MIHALAPIAVILASLLIPQPASAQEPRSAPSAERERPPSAVPTPGSVIPGGAETTVKWENSTFPSEAEGGIWPEGARFGWTFNHEFNAVTAPGEGSTAFSLMAIAHNHGSPANVVALGADTVLRSDDAAGFGGNIIVRTESAVARPKMVGLEIDIEPATGVTPAKTSIALPINMFNSRNPGPAIQTGGINGGTFANGIVLYGIAKSGAGLAAGEGASMNALVNSSVCECATAAFIHGTGISQGDAYGTKGPGVSPFVYGDEGNDLVVRLGSAGGLKVYASDGVSPVLEVAADGTLSAGGHRGVSCSGPPTSAFRTLGGIVVHC
ncbi:hypothetical protein [Novosphingobium soli]|uniref:Uncharacterized protein n=1 Tax=Novosphingobium soli TaxID=574956 RepID=A0ABV6CSN3_9SPHN